MKAELIVSPALLVKELRKQLCNPDVNRIEIAMAFVRFAGVALIQEEISRFCERAPMRLLIGLDFKMTSYEALDALLSAGKGNIEIDTFINKNNSCFHPKMYLFIEDSYATLLVGSANLTETGMSTNQEAFISIRLDLANPDDYGLYVSALDQIEKWRRDRNNFSQKVTRESLENLTKNGEITFEEDILLKRSVDHN